VFERLRAALDAALAAHTSSPNVRDLAAQMRQAVIELRAGVSKMREDLAATELQLAAEGRNRDDADRRGKLAAGIGDKETVEIAERFTAKHIERVGVLEQKLSAQRAELALAERELDDMTNQLRTVDRQGSGSAAKAWRDIDAAGGTRPETDMSDELLKSNLERQARESAAEQQLRELKKKMGK
jgi:hypothetical protein